MKKYCFTLFSVADLYKVNIAYQWLTLSNISIFDKNSYVREYMDRSIVDTIYIYSQLVDSEEEYGWILSGNLYITNEGLYSVNHLGEFIRIENGSKLYVFRVGGISKSFYHFLKLFSKKAWNIDVVFPFCNACESILSSKVHGIQYYDNPKEYIPSIIPGVDKEEDVEYLAKFIQQSQSFKERIIIKKDGFWWWNGIDILEVEGKDFTSLLRNAIASYLNKDFIVMDLLETTDVEYRVYWIKENWEAKVLEIHGKRRVEWQILHNIAQWNELIMLNKDTISIKLIQDIEQFCTRLSELHGGLDVLTDKNGKHYFTENNAMTWYLYEDAEKYFAKDWLDAIARCYQ